MNCPICKNEELEAGASQCSACSSDLSAFNLIGEVSNQQSMLKRLSTILGILVLLVAFGWVFTSMTGSTEVAATEQPVAVETEAAPEVEELNKAIEAKDSEIAELKAELSELFATIESAKSDIEVEDGEGGHTLHIVREGESLWSISEKYHGHGFKHDHIANHNELNDPHYIEVGDTIVVKH